VRRLGAEFLALVSKLEGDDVSSVTAEVPVELRGHSVNVQAIIAAAQSAFGSSCLVVEISAQTLVLRSVASQLAVPVLSEGQPDGSRTPQLTSAATAATQQAKFAYG